MTAPAGTPRGDPEDGPVGRIRDYFCLADGRTAALIHRDGRCDFWCWPSFDSPMKLARLLDSRSGGSVGVAFSRGSDSASWAGRSRVVSRIRDDGAEIRCGLLDDGAGMSALAWLVAGPSGEGVEVSIADPAAGGGPRWCPAGFGALVAGGGSPDGPGGPLVLVLSAPATFSSGRLLVELPAGGLAVCLGVPREGDRLPPFLAALAETGTGAVVETRRMLDASVADDERWLKGLHHGSVLQRLVQRAPGWALTEVDRSLLTLSGLQDRQSGLPVASPLTSIPQWPASVRAWDYRYAWLRDCADAGMALSRAGARAEAERLGEGLARLLGRHPERSAPVRRLSGSASLPEHVADHLRGYGGALVRIGNRAAGQVQLDTLGEVVRLAEELDRDGACPPQLLATVPTLAQAAAQNWRLPDHGIWEVRAEPQDYVHSKVMAWAALRSAAALARRGRVVGPADSWQRTSEEIDSAIGRRGTGTNGELVMSFQDTAADSSLLAAYLVGFISPTDARAPATLEAVSGALGRGPLMARHVPERDGILVPCFPFIFPGLWAVVAEALLGRSEAAEDRFRAILGLAGPAGQLSEVADPETGMLWGNYPQVQSHAALIEAALAIWAGEP